MTFTRWVRIGAQYQLLKDKWEEPDGFRIKILRTGERLIMRFHDTLNTGIQDILEAISDVVF